jgi:hypothetical protein
MQLSNGVEVLQWSASNDDYKIMPAVGADTWKQGAFLYFDGTNVKPFVPADTTVGGPLQAKIFAIASNGKAVGETKSIACLHAQILMAATNPLLGADAVVVYNATTGKQTAYEGGAYNTAYEPDVTLTGTALVFDSPTLEADGRIRMTFDGWIRFRALN